MCTKFVWDLNIIQKRGDKEEKEVLLELCNVLNSHLTWTCEWSLFVVTTDMKIISAYGGLKNIMNRQKSHQPSHRWNWYRLYKIHLFESTLSNVSHTHCQHVPAIHIHQEPHNIQCTWLASPPKLWRKLFASLFLSFLTSGYQTTIFYLCTQFNKQLRVICS